MLKAIKRRPIYVDTVDVSTVNLTSESTAVIVINNLSMYNIDRIFCITTDNCNAMAGVAKEINKKFKTNIQHMGCINHVFNLMVENSIKKLIF